MIMIIVRGGHWDRVHSSIPRLHALEQVVTHLHTYKSLLTPPQPPLSPSATSAVIQTIPPVPSAYHTNLQLRSYVACVFFPSFVLCLSLFLASYLSSPFRHYSNPCDRFSVSATIFNAKLSHQLCVYHLSSARHNAMPCHAILIAGQPITRHLPPFVPLVASDF